MTIGLLLCDHINELLQPRHGDYPAMFAAWLPHADWVIYDLPSGYFPESVHACDAFITTGSRFSVYDPLPWIARFEHLVQQLYREQKPYVGICFGHQMLAQALGGKVKPASVGWCVGNHEFKVIEPQPWMRPLQSSFRVLMSCQDQVLEMPPMAQVIAKSEDCPVGVFQCGDHLLGIQGHPEFTPAYNQDLIHLRHERIGSVKVSQALASFSRSEDRDLLSLWVCNFLVGAGSGQTN